MTRELSPSLRSASPRTSRRSSAYRKCQNLLLSSGTAEAELTGTVEPLRDVQTYVFREAVSADLLRRLKEVDPGIGTAC